MRVNKTFIGIMVVFVISGIVMVQAGLYFNSKWGSASGVIVDADTGKPVVGAEAVITGLFPSSKGKGTLKLVRSGKSRDGGVFHIPTTAGGNYALTVRCEGYTALDVEQITLVASQPNDLGTLAIHREEKE